MDEMSKIEQGAPLTHLCFAYGSNLDEAQLRQRCPGARQVGVATLEGYRLGFAGQSAMWGGGVATLVPDPQGSVSGVVWALTSEDLARLDRFEGHPVAYVRRLVEVELAQGGRRQVHAYIKDGAEATLPSEAYLSVLQRAYQEHGFDELSLMLALGEGVRSSATSVRVFVYGTLRGGEANHALLAASRRVGEGRTEPRYTLVSLGAFPAMVQGGKTAVVGEVYEVDAVTLAALDQLEGHPSFYRRRLIRLADGDEVQAYLLSAQQVIGRPLIPSGDWLNRG